MRSLLGVLLVFVSSYLLASGVARAQTVQAILVTDTLDSSIGAGISENRHNMKSFLQNVQTLTGLDVETIEVSGADFNCKSIVKVLESLTNSADDVVLFYYSGHGFREDSSQTKFPEFDCRRSLDPDTLGLSRAVTAIEAKRTPFDHRNSGYMQ